MSYSIFKHPLYAIGSGVLLLTLFIGTYAHAQEPPPLPSPASTAAIQALPARTERLPASGLALQHRQAVELLKSSWNQARLAMHRNDIATAEEHFERLYAARDEAGLSNTRDYALMTLAAAIDHARAGRAKEARALLLATRRLAPNDALVQLKLIPLARSLNEGSWWQGLQQIAYSLFSQPQELIRMCAGMSYPVLWAITAAVYIVVLYALAHSVLGHAVLGHATQGIAYRARRWRVLTLACATLAVSALGPLYGSAAMALTLFFTGLGRARLLFAVGAVFALWGTVVPPREKALDWYNDAHVQMIILAAQGSLTAAEEDNLERCRTQSEMYSEDGLLPLLCARILRREGKLVAATEMAHRASERPISPTLVQHEEGLLALLQSDYSRSTQLLINLHGARSERAAIAFNLSKLYFELGDTEKSAQSLADAMKVDSAAVKVWQDREGRLGTTHPIAFAGLPLSIRTLYGSVLQPRSSSYDRAQAIHAVLTPGLGPRGCSILGLALCAMALVMAKPGATRTRLPLKFKEHGLTLLSALLPGWRCVGRGEEIRAIVIVAVLLGLILPALQWPSDAAALATLSPELAQASAVIALIVYFLTTIHAWTMREGT